MEHFYTQTFYQTADNYTNAAKTQIKLTIFFQKTFTKQNEYAKIIKVAEYGHFSYFFRK